MPQITLRLPDELHDQIKLLSNAAQLRTLLSTGRLNPRQATRSAIVRDLIRIGLDYYRRRGARRRQPTTATPQAQSCSNPQAASFPSWAPSHGAISAP